MHSEWTTLTSWLLKSVAPLSGLSLSHVFCLVMPTKKKKKWHGAFPYFHTAGAGASVNRRPRLRKTGEGEDALLCATVCSVCLLLCRERIHTVSLFPRVSPEQLHVLFFFFFFLQEAVKGWGGFLIAVNKKITAQRHVIDLFTKL